MPKLVWNGGLELDWKVVSALIWAIWMTAAGWYKLEEQTMRLDAIEKAVINHNAWAAQRSEDLSVTGARLNSMEERIDTCCPLFPGRKGRHL